MYISPTCERRIMLHCPIHFWFSGFFIDEFPKMAMFKIIHSPVLMSFISLLNSQYHMICFSDCLSTILLSFPKLRVHCHWNLCPNFFGWGLNLGRFGWFRSHHSHHNFLPYVLDMTHVRTMARLFKDFRMIIFELFRHYVYVDSLFWIIVLIHPYIWDRVSISTNIFSIFFKNVNEIPLFNDTVNLDKVSCVTEREASPLCYISATMVHGINSFGTPRWIG